MPTTKQEGCFPSRKAVGKLVESPNFITTSRGARPRSNTSTLKPSNEPKAPRTPVPLGTLLLRGQVSPVGGNITTIYDGNDQPTEAQIRDGEGRLVSRIVRKYDANGRLAEEELIQENPALLSADKEQFTAAQLEAMNRMIKLTMGAGITITYAYDAQGRVTEMRNHNFKIERVTIISYNEHGDKSAEHETITTLTENSAEPRVTAWSIDENGTITPERTTEPTESTGPNDERTPEPLENKVRYEYEYDSYGNWTQQTENHGDGPDKWSIVLHRNLTYY